MVAVTGSNVEIKNREERVFTHLYEEKELEAGTWVLDTRVTNHMSRSQTAFTKLDTVCFNDNSVVRIDGHGTIVFMC
jgi:hypothetical protein